VTGNLRVLRNKPNLVKRPIKQNYKVVRDSVLKVTNELHVKQALCTWTVVASKMSQVIDLTATSVFL
jgi:hypothetical protein